MSGSIRDRWGSRRRSTNVIDLRPANNYNITLQWERSEEGERGPVAILLTNGSVTDFSVNELSNNIHLCLEVPNKKRFGETSPTPTSAQIRFLKRLSEVMKNRGGVVTISPPPDEYDVDIVQMFQSFINQR